MIDHVTNYDNVFFRMVSVSLAKTLTRSIRWINYFEDGTKIRVVVPFYLSMAGTERYAFDGFVDDVVDRRIELNTDIVPRGVITLQSISSLSDEFANPSQFLPKKAKINGKLRNIISKTKAIPIKLDYNVEIKVDNEIDSYKCIEKILNTFFNYMFFNIDYFGMKIDSVLELPDDKEITMPREHNLTSEKDKKISFSLSVRTYYPSFFIDTDDYEICSNDNDINWSLLGVTKPSELDDISKNEYNVKRVYWESFLNSMDLMDEEMPTRHKYDSFNPERKESFDPRGFINYPTGTTNA